MKRKYFCIMSVIFCIALSSCVSNPSYFNKTVIDSKKTKIAVLPFRDFNSSEGNNSGELIRNVFESRLILKGYNVIEIEKTASDVDYSFLKKLEFPSKWFVEIGKTLGVDYMLYGSIHDYRTFQNSSSFLYMFSWLETTSSVGVTARMISCRTGEVVWSGSFTRSSYNYNDAATEVVNVLIRSIKRKSEGSELSVGEVSK